MSIKNVALAGATGAAGAPILKGLLEAGFIVTALTRNATTIALPKDANLKAVSVDYADVDNLTKALTGVDAVVSAMSIEGFSGGSNNQANLITAAEKAGVKRFLPSEFGVDLQQFRRSKYPYVKIFDGKAQAQEQLKELSTKNPKFSYTFVVTKAFLDWGLTVPWLLVTGEDEVRIVDDGSKKISGTTLASVGKAVAGVLLHPEETKDRIVYVTDAEVTQNQLFELLKKVTPEREWKVVRETLPELEAKINAELAKPSPVLANMAMAIVTHGTFSHWNTSPQDLDNELLGLEKPWGEDKIEQMLRDLFAAKK